MTGRGHEGIGRRRRRADQRCPEARADDGQLPRVGLRSEGAGEVQPDDLMAMKVMATALSWREDHAGAIELFAKIADWPAFVQTFQVLYELREASDRMRRALTRVPATAAELERATQVMKDLFKRPESVEYLQPFLDVDGITPATGSADGAGPDPAGE